MLCISHSKLNEKERKTNNGLSAGSERKSYFTRALKGVIQFRCFEKNQQTRGGKHLLILHKYFDKIDSRVAFYDSNSFGSRTTRAKWWLVCFGKEPSSFTSWWFWYWWVSLVEPTHSVLYGVMLMPSLIPIPRLAAASVADESSERMAAKVETVACASVAAGGRITSSTVRRVYEMRI